MLAALRMLWLSLPVRKRLRFAFIVSLMALAALLEMLGVGALLPLISFLQSPDRIMDSPIAPMIALLVSEPTNQSAFIAVLVLLLLYFLLKNVFLVVLDIIQFRFLAELQAKISADLMSSYLRRPYEFHLRTNTAQIVRNVTSEVDTVFYYVMAPVSVVIAECLVIGALFLLLLVVNPKAAVLLIAIGGGLILAFFSLFRRKMMAIGADLQDSAGKMIQYAQEGLGGVKEIKVVGREAFFEHAFSRQVAQYSRSLRRTFVIHNLPAHVLETIFVLVFIASLVALAVMGKGGDAIPLIGLYAAAGFRLIPSLNRIMTGLNRLKQGSPSLCLLMAELADGRRSSEPAAGSPFAFCREISLRELRYRYPGAESDALDNVSLDIQRGERVGFIGRSGSGKTTLIDCILGLLTPTSGVVMVDGEDIQRNLSGWRQQIGYVPQHIFLTDDSFMRNVALGLADSDIDESRVWLALEAAQLAEFVRALPEGLHAPVGERGIRLSGGQRQRIGIARALYHEPALLVLDEATSALDGETEKAVVDTIRNLKNSITVLVIAHRMTTIKDCDRVFRLENGVLITSFADLDPE